ncbi:hypothetical protein JSCD17_36150 [Clostridioides difficile]|nr:hypothetical protein JSCD17_36150 [Clostridioides difficile]
MLVKKMFQILSQKNSDTTETNATSSSDYKDDLGLLYTPPTQQD